MRLDERNELSDMAYEYTISLYLLNKHRSLRYILLPVLIITIPLIFLLILFETIAISAYSVYGYVTISSVLILVIGTLLYMRRYPFRISIPNISKRLTKRLVNLMARGQEEEKKEYEEVIKSRVEDLLSTFQKAGVKSWRSMTLVSIGLVITVITFEIIVSKLFMETTLWNTVVLVVKIAIIILSMYIVIFSILAIIYRVGSIESVYLCILGAIISAIFVHGILLANEKLYLDLLLLVWFLAFLHILTSRNKFISRFIDMHPYGKHRVKGYAVSVLFLICIGLYYIIPINYYLAVLITMFFIMAMILSSKGSNSNEENEYKRSTYHSVIAAIEAFTVILIAIYSIRVIFPQVLIENPSLRLILAIPSFSIVLALLMSLTLARLGLILKYSGKGGSSIIEPKKVRKFLMIRINYFIYGLIFFVFSIIYVLVFCISYVVFGYIDDFLFVWDASPVYMLKGALLVGFFALYLIVQILLLFVVANTSSSIVRGIIEYGGRFSSLFIPYVVLTYYTLIVALYLFVGYLTRARSINFFAARSSKMPNIYYSFALMGPLIIKNNLMRYIMIISISLFATILVVGLRVVLLGTQQGSLLVTRETLPTLLAFVVFVSFVFILSPLFVEIRWYKDILSIATPFRDYEAICESIEMGVIKNSDILQNYYPKDIDLPSIVSSSSNVMDVVNVIKEDMIRYMREEYNINAITVLTLRRGIVLGNVARILRNLTYLSLTSLISILLSIFGGGYILNGLYALGKYISQNISLVAVIIFILAILLTALFIYLSRTQIVEKEDKTRVIKIVITIFMVSYILGTIISVAFSIGPNSGIIIGSVLFVFFAFAIDFQIGFKEIFNMLNNMLDIKIAEKIGKEMEVEYFEESDAEVKDSDTLRHECVKIDLVKIFMKCVIISVLILLIILPLNIAGYGLYTSSIYVVDILIGNLIAHNIISLMYTYLIFRSPIQRIYREEILFMESNILKFME